MKKISSVNVLYNKVSLLIYETPNPVADSEESACNVGDLGSIPGLGSSPRGGHGNPLQYSFWRIPMDRGAWWATVHRDAKSWTQLSN